MRLLVAIFLFLIASKGISQKSKDERIKVSFEKLQSVNTIDDLLPSLPEGCQVITCEIVLKVGEKVRVYSFNKNQPINFLKDLKAGDNIHLDITRLTCKSTVKKEYHFLIVP